MDMFTYLLSFRCMLWMNQPCSSKTLALHDIFIACSCMAKLASICLISAAKLQLEKAYLKGHLTSEVPAARTWPPFSQLYPLSPSLKFDARKHAGGEGATAREVLRHKSVERVLMVDIDKVLQHLGEVADGCCLNMSRVLDLAHRHFSS